MQQTTKLYEDEVGKFKARQLPPDNSIQLEDKSETLTDPNMTTVYRGIAVSLPRKVRCCLTVMELAGKMANPAMKALHHLIEFIGHLKSTVDYCLGMRFPQAGERYVKKGECHWCLETFSDSDWSGNKKHRRSTSRAFHAINGCPLFNGKTQKVVSLSSCEAELRAMISAVSDGIYIRAVLEFALGTKVNHYIFIDSSSARQFVIKDGKLLRIESRKDITTTDYKPLGGQRMGRQKLERKRKISMKKRATSVEERERETHRETQRDTERHRETQRDTGSGGREWRE